MNPNETRTKNRPNDTETTRNVRRRHFLALGASMGATVLAGCSTETDLTGEAGGGTTPTGSNDAPAESGTFRLLISDQPVAIGDFDELNVSFDRARIFRGEGAGDDEGEATEAASETETATETATETGTATETETETEDEESDTGDQEGFSVIDLGGATVDLTQVVGDKAIGVFDGALPEGRYTKIELYAANVEGIVAGEPVNVTIPSGKLQIIKPFEVGAGETLSFVFDINVVKKGQTGEYNLLPVISESGVAGEHVEVDEVGNAQAGTDEEETEEAETEEDGTEESAGEDGSDNDQGEGPPDDAGGDS